MYRYVSGLIAVGLALAPALAKAHIGVVSGPAFTDRTYGQDVTFGVGHGCSGADTSRVQIDIPQGVTSVRAMPSAFGAVRVERDAALNPSAVVWTKAPGDMIERDDNYYTLTIRIRVPDQPFTTLRFSIHQTCQALDGTTTEVAWVDPSDTAPDGGEAHPAATLLILPARKPGWNKYAVPVAISDLSEYFEDALIVWKGNSAYSPNPASAELIPTTAGVTPLTALAAGDEIWVKY